MKTLLRSPWRRRGAVLGLMLLLLAVAVWAPVPLAQQLAFRVALGVIVYLGLVGAIVRDALATFDPNDPAHSPRTRARIQACAQPRRAPRTIPLTAVQRRYLDVVEPQQQAGR